MEPGRRPRVWYFFSSDLPEGELIMPIKTRFGLAFAVRPDAGMEQEMLDQLNRTAEFVLGVGLAHLDGGEDDDPHLDGEEDDTPPEREE